MEIGSLVKCIKKSNWADVPETRVITPVVNNIYTIRGFYDNGSAGISVYLEEIINKNLEFIAFAVEPSFNKNCFVEVLPPINILEEIEKTELSKILELTNGN